MRTPKNLKKRLLNGRVKWGKSERDRNKNSEGGKVPEGEDKPLDAGSFVGLLGEKLQKN